MNENTLNKNKKIIENIYSLITKQKNISLFVHEYPDFDALSSACALRKYLKDKNINCKIIGLDKVDKDIFKKFYEQIEIDEYDEKFINSSYAVILDTANVERVHTQLHTKAKKIIRIDHHPKIQTIGDIEWVDDNMSSTSEMIGWLINLNDKNGFNTSIVNFLYTGILADTGNFMYSLTKQSTFELVAKFYHYNFNKNQIQDLMFLKSWDTFKKDLKILKKVRVINNIAYLILNKSNLKKLKLLKSNVVKVHLMNNFKDFKIWITIIYNIDQNNWKCSIRSRDYNVNTIAKKYNGGGHILASGFKLNTKKEVKNLINFLGQINLDDYKVNN